MQPHSWTVASIHTHEQSLSDQLFRSGHIRPKGSALAEAHARGLGFNTLAAQNTALKTTPELSARAFAVDAFVERLAELTDDTTAEVADAVLHGASLDVVITKRLEPRQRAGHYLDVSYDAEATVRGLPPGLLADDVLFHLPVFGREAGGEPYRVDSGHDRRAPADYTLYHGNSGNTRVAKLLGGHWYGGMYVYATEHQADDARSIQSARTALARAILPRLPVRPRCWIFKPDRYDERAWRVELRLPPEVLHFWNGSPFVFDIPQLPKWMFHMTPDHIFNGLETGQFVDGVWRADLYSNGVPVSENPVRLETVKRLLLTAIDHTIAKSGHHELRGQTLAA